jgi:heptaprenyl diphosphate synthase
MARASPGALFAAGAALLPAFLFQQDIVLRTILFVMFLVLNAVSGRGVRLLQYLLVAAGIVIFNLVIPTGRILISPLGLPVTEVALKAGLSKATAMVGLIALSRFSIRADLRFPGRLGGLLGASLMYFERIMGQRRSIDRRDIIGSIDAMLLSIHGAPSDPDPSRPPVRTSPGAAAVLIAVAGAAWSALGWTFVHPHPFWG